MPGEGEEDDQFQAVDDGTESDRRKRRRDRPARRAERMHRRRSEDKEQHDPSVHQLHVHRSDYLCGLRANLRMLFSTSLKLKHEIPSKLELV